MDGEKIRENSNILYDPRPAGFRSKPHTCQNPTHVKTPHLSKSHTCQNPTFFLARYRGFFCFNPILHVSGLLLILFCMYQGYCCCADHESGIYLHLNLYSQIYFQQKINTIFRYYRIFRSKYCHSNTRVQILELILIQ